MREFGITAAAALSFVTALGAAGAFISFLFDSEPDFAYYWVPISLFAAIVMTMPALALAPYHIMRPAAAEILGLLARSPRSTRLRTAM
jgi:hypothetical protein